jgi:class 3 adenylate cyclase/tetratricopeptide (TPR) repeat protein
VATERTTCAACGSPNRAGRKFCADCGAALAVSCPSCGAANEPGERFCGECGTPIDGASAAAQAPTVAVERRLVSVLFADLVGFTPLSEDRDAEEVRELLSRYFEIAARVVGRYGGEVEKFIGDAVMAVWGTPVAQEDDAERAVRAALELVGEVSAFGGETGLPELAARAAVLTGEAAVNLGASGQGMVAGDLVNAASRLQSAAEPNTVLVGESTRRATGAAVSYAEAGLHELKGKVEPIPAWRALRVTAGRAGGLKSEGLEPPFVGRERELRLAKELFHAVADEGKAHLLSITGIAGIGKSRLAWELYKYLDGITQQVAWHRGRCLAYGDGVTYWALAEMIRMRAGIAEGEDTDSAGPKLEAALELAVEDADERAWIRTRLAQVLSLEARQDLEQSDLFGGWRLFFERLAERDPVVLVFEDMQWADPPLLAYIEYLLEWSRNHRILVVALARPELAERHAHWTSGLRNATTLALEPLSRGAMESLLEGFVPGLPSQVSEQILDRSEGVPLYAVETVRMLLDRGLVEQVDGEYRPTGTIAALDVPETLQALIAARLDGLSGDERGLLQDASILGKTFTTGALAAVSGQTEPDLQHLLTGLVRKEVLSLQSDPRAPERGQYGFLQDLLRQVAYETLPRRERKSRHLGAAEYLEQRVDQDEVAEIVASHYLTALELDRDAADATSIRSKAESTLVQAGDRAEALAASENAQRYFEQALELSDSPLRQAELHERAGRMAYMGARTAEARTHFEQAIASYGVLGLTHPAARVGARLGTLTWEQEGDVDRAVAEMEKSFSALEHEEHDADLATFAATLARLLYFRGRVDEAMERNEFALEIAESLELPEVLAQGLITKAVILDLARGRHDEAGALLSHALEVALANDRSEAILRAYNNINSRAEGDDRYREADEGGRKYAAFGRKVGDRVSETRYAAWRINTLGVLGEWDEALALADVFARDETPAAQRQRGWVESGLLRIMVHRGELDEARRRLILANEVLDPNDIQDGAIRGACETLVLFGEGRLREAQAAAERALAARGDLGLRHPATKEALSMALTAAVALGDEAKVDELLAIIEQTPPGQQTPFLRATGARFGARRAALQGDATSAGAGLAAAADILREIERPFDRAVVLLEHAEWLAAEGRAEEAEPLVAEAHEIFERLRAAPYLERLEMLSLGDRVAP